MNKVELIGNLTKDVEQRGEGDKTIARFTLAVAKRFKKEGQPEADFLNVKAFGKLGETAAKWLSKGKKAAVVGRIETGSYEKDGRTTYYTEIIAEEIEFLTPKQDNGYSEPKKEKQKKASYDEQEEIQDDDLPF